jgi:outer membrane protein assembly factor BamB
VATGATSWGPVNVGVNWANAAYDDGKIYVVNDDGDVAAYDAASGTRVWFQTSPTSQSSASSPPIAKDGMVFGAASGIGGTVFALDGKTGALQWRAQVANGDQSSPSLGPEGLFVSYACLQTYGFNPIEGSLLWHADGPCQGGGGMTTALYQGQLWTRDWSTGNQVVDARSGAMLHGFEGDRIPAFLGSRAFILLDSTLRAIDLATFATLWSFTGDGALTSAPLVAGGFVYITSRAGLVFAVDPSTGDSPWSAELGAFVNEVGNTHDFVFTPMPGLAAGQGVLLVPQGPLLVAFQ